MNTDPIHNENSSPAENLADANTLPTPDPAPMHTADAPVIEVLEPADPVTIQATSALAPLSSILERKKSFLAHGDAEDSQAAARAQTQEEAQQDKKELATLSDYIAAEVSLETIGYFVPSSTRIKNIDTKEEVIDESTNPDGTKNEVKVVFIYSRKYGIPNTTDQDYYYAFLKILDESVDRLGHIPEPLELPSDKLIRYAGKHWRGGKGTRKRTTEEVRDFIQVNRYTGIQGQLYNAKTDKYSEVGEEPLFRKYVLRGEPLEDGNLAETNYVWLASWFRTNYENHYVRTVDHAYHSRLRKPIAKALVQLLATGWYASKGQPYEKSYRALCQKFLLKEHRQLSLIKQQLDPSHRELQGYLIPRASKAAKKTPGLEYLSKWEYRRAADGQDWIITFYPGEKFFTDREAVLARRDVARSLSSTVKPSAAKSTRSKPANHPADFEHYIGEITRVLGPYQSPDELETQKKLNLFKKWLRHYPFYGVIDQALSEYRHDTQDLPSNKHVQEPIAYFQAVLHRTAHQQGMEWIRACSVRCQYRPKDT